MSWPSCDRVGCNKCLGGNYCVRRVQLDDAQMDMCPDGTALLTRTAAAFCSLDCLFWHLMTLPGIDTVQSPEDRPAVQEEPF